MACANVSNLLLSKTGERRKEMTVRAALGASRWRIIRQLLTESLLIALAGGVLGVLLAVGSLQAVLAIVPPDTIPDEAEVTLSIPVLLFALLVSALTSIIFGLAPALHTATHDLANPLRKGLISAFAAREVLVSSLAVVDPAPVREWQKPGDPRAKITIGNLMQMSSGLRFSDSTDAPEMWEHGMPDHLYIYSGAIDVFNFSISRPPEFAPNTVGRYRNSDALTLGAIIKRTVGRDYLTWPQRALFDRIGIRRQVLEN